MKHTVKKLSSLFLALSLAAGLCLTPALAAETNYADAQASWAASSIERWSNSGIVKGDGNGNFNPDAPLSRAELAQIFVNMFGLTEKAENTFGDLMGDQWYADAILKCAAAGIMKGDGVNANAEANISRAETIVMFGRAVGVTPDAKPDLSKFSDADSVAAWAAGYLAPLAKMGILSGGGDGTLNADGQIDRASTMALLDKSIAEYVSAPGEYKVDNANGFVIVNVAAKEGEVVISGTAAGVAVSAGTAEGKIVAKDLNADTIKVDGAAAVSVEGKSAVGDVVANATGEVSIAKGVTVDTVTANSTGTVANAGTVNSIVANGAATVSNIGTVKELVANAPATVDNKGTITKAEVKADGVVLDGKKPTTVTVDEGTKNPTNSDGKEVKPGTDKPSGGGSYVPPSSTTVSTLEDLNAALDNSQYSTITLGENISGDGQIVIERPVTLDGNGKSITSSNDYAIHVYNVNGAVTIKNITANGHKGAILVNGSNVTLEGNVTVVGEWGGIEVGQGGGIANPGSLNIGSATLVHVGEAADKPTVWADSDTVGTVSGGSLTKVVVEGQSFYYLTAVSPESLTAMLANSSLATIKLGDDISGAGQIVISRPVTLDGNGKSITSSDNYAIHVYNVAGTVTLKDITANGATNNKGAILVNGSTVNLEGTITVTGAWGGIEVGKSDVGVANKGELNVGSATLVHAGEAANKPTVWADTDAEGTVSGGSLTKVVVGGQSFYYLTAVSPESLTAMLANSSLATITLGTDIEMNTSLVLERVATLDLNDNMLTIDGEDNSLTVIGSGAHLTLKDSGTNGLITCTDARKESGVVLIELQDGAEMTMKSGTIKADFGSVDMTEAQAEGTFAIGVFNDSTFTMDGGVITAGWYAISTNGTTGSSSPTYGDNAKIIINDGTLTSTGDYAIYAPANGGVTEIHGGTISGAWGALQIRRGTLEITGGELINTSGIVGTKPEDQTDGSTPDTATALSAISNYGDITITISGGSLTAGENSAAIKKTDASGHTATISITGGDFTSDVSDFCQSGYACTGSGTSWTVTAESNT